MQVSLQLAALANSAVPGLEVVGLRAPQHETADFSYCGLVDSQRRNWIVQAARHESASASLEAEIPLLAQLDAASREGLIAFDVIRPEGMTNMPDGAHVLIYREPPGEPLELSNLTAGPGPTASVGRAIAQIHELPHSLFEAADAAVFDAESYRAARLAELDEAARTSKVPPILLARWEHAIADDALWHFTATPVHGDLAPENVLISNGTVAAILNWSNAHIGDPAEDLAWLYAAAPERALDALDESYAMGRSVEPDAYLGARATLYSELAIARWLLHGVRLGDQAIISDAEYMLHALARQVMDSEPAMKAIPVPPEDTEIDWVEVAATSPWSAIGSDDGTPDATPIPTGGEHTSDLHDTAEFTLELVESDFEDASAEADVDAEAEDEAEDDVPEADADAEALPDAEAVAEPDDESPTDADAEADADDEAPEPDEDKLS